MNSAKTLAKNTGFSLAADLFNRASNTLLFVLVSRFLGLEVAGVMTLAMTYTFIANPLSFWGLDQLLIREVARAPGSVRRFTVNFIWLRVVLSLISIGLLRLILQFIVPYPAETTRIIFLMALSIFSENISNICQAVFMAHERMECLASVGLLMGVTKLGEGQWP